VVLKNKMPKKILFISKDNLTTNPRLLKKLKVTNKNGAYFSIKVGFCIIVG